MKKLIALCGLPGAGKSTWAHEYCYANDGVVRISRDDIRAELKRQGWEWTKAAEKRDVIPERDRLIRQALRAGWSVIADDTNLTNGHLDGLALIASSEGAEFEVKSFLNVAIGVCIARDAERAQPIGEAKIRELAAYTLSLPEWVL